MQKYTKQIILPVWVAHWYRIHQWVQGSRVQTRPRPVNFKFLKNPEHIKDMPQIFTKITVPRDYSLNITVVVKAIINNHQRKK